MPETHALNCALLIPNTVKGAERKCSCQVKNVHDHGPDSGQGLSCPEYKVRGKLVGWCLLTEKQRHMLDSGVEWRQVPGQPEPVPARRAGTGSPVASELWDASQGEVRTTSATGGQKGVKEARFDLIPTEALTKLAEHYAVGARKYGDHNWRKGFEYSKSYAALQRHLVAWWGGEDLDPETGKSHLTAVAFHAFTLLTFQAEHPEFDDRFKKGATDGEITE